MKKQIVLSFILLAVLWSCSVAPKVVIPDEPKYGQITIYPVEAGICLDADGIAALKANVTAMKGYADALRKELERVRDGK